jgi:YVTN family beta-propeller protein
MLLRLLRANSTFAILTIMVLLATTAGVSAHATGSPAKIGAAMLALTITTKTITVGTQPGDALYSPASKEVYVVNEGSKTVSAISSSTYAVTTITVGTDPFLLTYSTSTGDVYVLNFASGFGGTISVISSTNKVLKTITFASGVSPSTQAYDPATGDVYVVCNTVTGSAIFDINKATWALKAITVPTGERYLFVTYDNASSSLVFSSPYTNSVTAVSKTDTATTIKLTVGYTPTWMVYNPHDSDLYITDEGFNGKTLLKTGNVSVLSSSNKIITTLKVGYVPTTGWYDPVNFDIYEINTGYSNGITFPTSTVSVISTSNVVAKTLTVGKYAVIAAFDPKNSEMYVSCPASNLTYAFTSTNSLAAKVTTKEWSGASAYDPALGEMLAPGLTKFFNFTASKTIVTVIPSSNTGTSTVTLGIGPLSGATYDPADLGFFGVNQGANTVSVIL